MQKITINGNGINLNVPRCVPPEELPSSVVVWDGSSVVEEMVVNVEDVISSVVIEEVEVSPTGVGGGDEVLLLALISAVELKLNSA